MAGGIRPSVLTGSAVSNPVITPKSRGGTFADRKTVACPPRTSMLLPKPGYEHERHFESSGPKSRLSDRGSTSTDSFDDDMGVDVSFEPDGEGYDSDKESQYESIPPRVRHDSGFLDEDDDFLPLDPAKAQLLIASGADVLDAREAELSIKREEQPEAISQKSFMNQLKTGLKKFFKMVMDFASKHKIAIGLALSLIFVAIMCTPAGPAIAAGAGLGILMSVGLISSSVFFGALLVDLMGGLGPDASRVPQPNSGQNQNQSSDKETSKTESADRANGGDSGGARSTDGTFHIEPQSASQSRPVSKGNLTANVGHESKPASKGNPTSNVGVQSSAASETQYEQPFSLERFETWVHEHIGKWAHEDMWGEFIKNRSTREAGERVIDDPAHLEDFCKKFFEHDIELIEKVKAPLTDETVASIPEQAELMRSVEEIVRTIIAKMQPTSDFLSQMQLSLGAAAQDLGPYFTSDLTKQFYSLEERPYYESDDPTPLAEIRSSDLVRIVQKTLAEESQRIAQEEALRAVEESQRIAQEEAERARKERAVHIGVNTEAPIMKDTAVEMDAPIMKDTAVEMDAPIMKDTAVEMDAPIMKDTAVEMEAPIMHDAGVGGGSVVNDDEPTDPNLADRERRQNVLKERRTKNVTKSDLAWKKPEISLIGNSFHRFLTELDGCANGLDWAMNNSNKKQQLDELDALFKNKIRNSEPDRYDKSYMELVVEEVALVVKARTLAIIGVSEKKGENGDLEFVDNPLVTAPEVKSSNKSEFIKRVMDGDLGEGFPKIQDAFDATSASPAEQELVKEYISEWMNKNWKPSN